MKGFWPPDFSRRFSFHHPIYNAYKQLQTHKHPRQPKNVNVRMNQKRNNASVALSQSRRNKHKRTRPFSVGWCRWVAKTFNQRS